MATKYEICSYRDAVNGSQEKPYQADVYEVTAPGTEVEELSLIYTSDYQPAREVAEQECKNWLWEHKQRYASLIRYR